jgi:hypothetical protein
MAANAEVTTDSVQSTTCELIEALDAMKPDAEAQMAIDFAEIFLPVKAAKERGVPPRQIIEGLKKKWPDLHHATFRKLFNAELAARDENGERVCCVTCGQSLHAKEQHHTEESAPLVDTTGTDGEVAA